MKKIFPAALGAASILIMAATAEAQQATQSPGPLVMVGRGPGVLLMVSDLPSSPPDAPVEFWQWLFAANTLTADGTPYNTLAIRSRADCSNRTIETLRAEAYLAGVFAIQTPLASPAEPAAAGSADEMMLNALCSMDSVTAAPRYADMAAAQAHADTLFSTDR